MSNSDHQWVFGYGSLIWRPGFDYLERSVAHIQGYKRRFWQGSHDHRGVPDRPGRVVTLIPETQSSCIGMAYLIDQATVSEVFENLDYREKNGYERHDAELNLSSGEDVSGLVYIAPINNFAYLGDAPLAQIATQIAESEGPSGRNCDYLYELANTLRELGAEDHHVFELETKVRSLLKHQNT